LSDAFLKKESLKDYIEGRHLELVLEITGEYSDSYIESKGYFFIMLKKIE